MKYLIASIFWIYSASVILINGQPTISSVEFSTNTVDLYEKLELAVELTASFTNPYDYNQVSLQAIITKPNGSVDTIDGFYTETLKINDATGLTQISGPGQFAIRYAPYTIGMHSLKLKLTDQNGIYNAEEMTFLAKEGIHTGFIRTSNSAYLQFDNQDQYIPIGENISWQNSNVYFDYRAWINALSESGGNFMRLWHAHWGLGIEWLPGWNNHLGLKKYNQVASTYQDWLYDFCAEKGIYVMLALQHHGQVSTAVNPNWNENPYNAALGGPCINTWDFFINEEAKTLTKNRLRYVIARWGYSRAIMCWELFNEVEWTDNFELYEEDIIDWHLEMADYIRKKDVYGHLISTSFANDVGGERLWQNELMDITQIHYYGNTGNIHQALVRGAQSMTDRYSKPVLVGEFGLGSGTLTNSLDPDGIHFHNGMWSTLLGGSMGTGMTWWWDQYIHPRNLYYHFQPLSVMSRHIDFVDRNLKPTTNSFIGATADLTIQPTLNWGVLADDSITIKNGIISPTNPNLSLFLYGSQYNTQFRSPPTFYVDYPEAGNFTVRTGHSGATSPRIQVSVDGVIVIDEIALINKSYSVLLPAGEHSIKVDNSGTDWINIASYFFENIGTAGEAFTLLSESNKFGAGWILNREYNHANINNGGIPVAISESNLVIENVDDIDYLITWYDPLSGEVAGEVLSSANNNRLNLALPEFIWDMAFTFEPTSATSVSIPLQNIEFKIYPNPLKAGNSLHIDYEGSLQIIRYKIYNSEGKTLVSNDLNENNLRIPEELNEGFYWLQINNGYQVSSKPFIIIK
jgi:hypothetical protein